MTEIGFNQSEFRLFVRPREIAFVDKGPFWNFSFCSVEAATGAMQNGNWLEPSKSPELEAFQAGATLISNKQLLLLGMKIECSSNQMELKLDKLKDIKKMS